MAHRTKRAKPTAEGEPTTSAGRGTASPDVVVSSPQPSPRREAATQYPLASSSADAPISEPDKEMGEERQEEERPEANPALTPPSTIVPKSSSPARASADDLVRTTDAPASEAAGNQATTTEVVGEENISSQQTPTGNPLAFQALPILTNFSFFFVFLNLILIYLRSFCFSYPPPTDDMETDIDVEGIAKSAANEAAKVAAEDAAKSTDDEATRLAAAETDRVAAEEAARVAAAEAGKIAAEEPVKAAATETSEATSGTPVSGAPIASTSEEVRTTIAPPPTVPEAPPSRRSHRLASIQWKDVPSSSTVATTEGTDVEEELVIPPSSMTEEEHDKDDDAEDYLFLVDMKEGFKAAQQRFSRRWEKLQLQKRLVEGGRQELLQRADEAQSWYAERVQEINDQHAELAPDKNAFILEKAEFEMAQEAAAKEAEATDRALTERKVNLDAHEEDLAAREASLAATLKAKDDEVQALIAKQTQELEQAHKEILAAQVQEHAAKLKESADAVAAATTAKTDLEAKVRKLEEDLAGGYKEIATLKDVAQKVTHTLGELQTRLSSKNQELSKATDAAEDLKTKLATLEENLESGKTREAILVKDLEKAQIHLTDAETKFNQLKNSLALWTEGLVDTAERLTRQLAVMDMKSWSFTVNDKEAASVRLTKFFKGLIEAPETYQEERAASFATSPGSLLVISFTRCSSSWCTAILALISLGPSRACRRTLTSQLSTSLSPRLLIVSAKSPGMKAISQTSLAVISCR